QTHSRGERNYTELPLVSFIPTTSLKHNGSAESRNFNAILAIVVLKKTSLGTKRTGEYTNGSTFTVSKITSAEPLCFSDVVGIKDTRG
ncbi:6769_t:CDS:2, partial [Racocetra persica]